MSGRRARGLRARPSLRLLAVVGGLIAVGAPASAAADGPRTLRTGFMDNSVLRLDGSERAGWLGRATSVGASLMRVNLHWNEIAPTAPPAELAADPAWPGYRFAEVDGEIKAAHAAGMTVLLNVSQAPPWAEGADKTKADVGYAGNYKPDPVAFGRFMSAVAKRYQGTTADPADPAQRLPRVGDFQIWNEPNLNLYLAPQYENGRPFAPVRFRELVNAGYAAIKAVQPSADVVAAGLAPFGDAVGRHAARTRPVAFLRSMLCLRTDLRKACAATTRADAFSLHPYSVGRPGRSARDRDDATIPDVGRINAVLRQARKLRTVGPALPRTWVTEVSYDSSPPDPEGIPIARRARWISETMYRLWRAGVGDVVWYLMRDDAPTPSYAATYQSGIFLRDGQPKGDAAAFRLPLMVTGTSGSRLDVWLRSPVAGRASVQARRGGRWVTVARTARLPVDGVATVRIPRAKVTAVRAVAGTTTSYAWSLR